MNIRSLSKNSQKIIETISTLNEIPQILALTETWLTNANKAYFQIDNYIRIDAIRNSKTKKRGGGVSIFLNKNIKILKQENIGINGIDAILTEIVINKNPLEILVIYRPQPPEVTYNRFIKFLEKILYSRNNETIILGDFNIDVYMPTDKTKIKQKLQLLDLLASYNFDQIVNSPTRETQNSKTIIDHVITNFSNKVAISQILDISGQDHAMIVGNIFINLKNNQQNNENKYPTLPANKNNINQFQESCSLFPWQINTNNPDSKLGYIHDSTQLLLSQIGKNIKIKNSEKNPFDKPWCNNKMKSLIIKKNKLYGLLRNFPKNIKLKEKWIKIRSKLNVVRRKNKREFIRKTLTKSTNKNKDKWSIIRKINNIDKPKNCPTGNDTDIAYNFLNHWKTEKENTVKYIETGSSWINNNLFFLYPTNLTEIYNIILSLNKNATSGWDHIDIKFVQSTANIYKILLTDLINNIIDTLHIPKELKHTTTIPIYKNGNKDDLNNYRPITILSTFAKIVDKFLFNRINNFIIKKKILNPRQHGFCEGKNTVTALEIITTNIFKYWEDKKVVTGICIDLKKAFDCINHSILLKKLKKYGLTGPIQDILKSYITDRSYAVKINNTYSDHAISYKGIPQGSSLGPLLFNLYINDLLNELDPQIDVVAYADDITIILHANNTIEMKQKIFSTLRIIDLWMENNDMKINYSKTKLINFRITQHTNKMPNRETYFKYKDMEIEIVECVKILGIWLDANLNFKKHLQEISAHLSPIIGIFNKNKNSTSIDLKLDILKSILIPKITYAISIWYINCKYNKQMINKLYKRCIRTLTSKFTKTQLTIDKYKLYTIDRLYKNEINIQTRIQLEKNNNTALKQNQSNRCKNYFSLSIPKHNLSRFKRSLKYRRISEFNSLPKVLRNKNISIKEFTRRVKMMV